MILYGKHYEAGSRARPSLRHNFYRNLLILQSFQNTPEIADAARGNGLWVGCEIKNFYGYITIVVAVFEGAEDGCKLQVAKSRAAQIGIVHMDVAHGFAGFGDYIHMGFVFSGCGFGIDHGLKIWVADIGDHFEGFGDGVQDIGFFAREPWIITRPPRSPQKLMSALI